MIDYQAVVDEIRYAIQSEDCELTDALRQANAQYAEACRDINKRLRRVSELLNAGLRSEAIQFGEGPPNLNDVVTILSFPEAEEWSGIVMMYDLPPAEKLNMEVVERLSEAQLIEQPLQKLLARHRRLALVRAPLQTRLAVLRELYQEDPETYTWEEDVREFEKARFSELSIAAREAHQYGNRDALRQIHEELNSENWLEEAPPKLIAAVRKSLAGLSRQSARDELVQVAADLDAAFSELDLDRAKLLRNRWLQLKKEAGVAADDPLMEQLSPVLGWIADEEDREDNEHRYEQSIAQLERLLHGNGSIEELERVEHEIHRLDRSLPDLLATRLAHRINTLKLTETRVHRLKLGAAIGTLLVLVAFVSVLAYREMRANEVATLAAHVEQLLKDRQYEQAETALNSRSDVMRWESLMTLQTRLATELKQEQERSQRLQQQFSVIEQAANYSAAVAALAEARKHLLTPADKLEFERLKGNWESRHHQEMADRQRAVQDGIQEATTKLVEADRDLAENPEDPSLSQLLRETSDQLKLLRTQAADLEPAIGNQVKLLQSRHQKLIDLRAQRIEIAGKQRMVTDRALIATRSINFNMDVKAYQDALNSYADVLEGDPNTDAMRESVKGGPFWVAALEWSKLIRSWNQVWPTASAQAKLRIETCEEFLDNHPGSPDSELIVAYLRQLKSIQSREAAVGDTEPKLKDRLQRIFKTPLIAESWLLETKDGKRYYLPEQQKFSDKLFKFSHFVGYSADELRECGDVRPDNLRVFETIRSPCSEVAIWASRELNHVDAASWNQFCANLAAKLVANDQMNPFLKLDLLRRTLEAAGEGDSFLQAALASHLKLLQDAPVSPLARWMNPEDIEGKRATIEAEKVLEQFQRLQSLEAVWKSAEDSQNQMTRQLETESMMVGWLRKNGTQWFCETGWDKQGNWKLYVAFANDELTKSQWREIGKVDDGMLQLKPTATGFLAPGRPVFAMKHTAMTVAQQ